MTLTEIKKDLFTMPKEYALAHCISDDRAMGAGIAVQFTKRGVKQLLDQKYGKINPDEQNPMKWGTKGYCLSVVMDGQHVMNLVTKNRYWHKPTIASLGNALHSMKIYVRENNIKKIAMPMIGCGLDKLDPETVKELIEYVFQDEDVEIVICRL